MSLAVSGVAGGFRCHWRFPVSLAVSGVPTLSSQFSVRCTAVQHVVVVHILS